ncbi:hypothetical protein GPECTOR_8g268 [Gonium pectorale]|uniref:Uncharacterized protein n=1 Tax=Gonium pectorale TaxID=33097 RepID=A0A150GT72_GONPE|nr:hypothetical protein GPECTOR_8g268 [Gonium pectorale]|eukprot:KXZ52888.1 hypothetical protein GPECTOR_8g268 [Gonium pectorale]
MERLVAAADLADLAAALQLAAAAAAAGRDAECCRGHEHGYQQLLPQLPSACRGAIRRRVDQLLADAKAAAGAATSTIPSTPTATATVETTATIAVCASTAATSTGTAAADTAPTAATVAVTAASSAAAEGDKGEGEEEERKWLVRVACLVLETQDVVAAARRQQLQRAAEAAELRLPDLKEQLGLAKKELKKAEADDWRSRPKSKGSGSGGATINPKNAIVSHSAGGRRPAATGESNRGETGTGSGGSPAAAATAPAERVRLARAAVAELEEKIAAAEHELKAAEQELARLGPSPPPVAAAKGQPERLDSAALLSMLEAAAGVAIGRSARERLWEAGEPVVAQRLAEMEPGQVVAALRTLVLELRQPPSSAAPPGLLGPALARRLQAARQYTLQAGAGSKDERLLSERVLKEVLLQPAAPGRDGGHPAAMEARSDVWAVVLADWLAERPAAMFAPNGPFGGEPGDVREVLLLLEAFPGVHQLPNDQRRDVTALLRIALSAPCEGPNQQCRVLLAAAAAMKRLGGTAAAAVATTAEEGTRRTAAGQALLRAVAGALLAEPALQELSARPAKLIAAVRQLVALGLVPPPAWLRSFAAALQSLAPQLPAADVAAAAEGLVRLLQPRRQRPGEVAIEAAAVRVGADDEAQASARDEAADVASAVLVALLSAIDRWDEQTPDASAGLSRPQLGLLLADLHSLLQVAEGGPAPADPHGLMVDARGAGSRRSLPQCFAAAWDRVHTRFVAAPPRDREAALRGTLESYGPDQLTRVVGAVLWYELGGLQEAGGSASHCGYGGGGAGAAAAAAGQGGVDEELLEVCCEALLRCYGSNHGASRAGCSGAPRLPPPPPPVSLPLSLLRLASRLMRGPSHPTGGVSRPAAKAPLAPAASKVLAYVELALPGLLWGPRQGRPAEGRQRGEPEGRSERASPSPLALPLADATELLGAALAAGARPDGAILSAYAAALFDSVADLRAVGGRHACDEDAGGSVVGSSGGWAGLAEGLERVLLPGLPALRTAAATTASTSASAGVAGDDGGLRVGRLRSALLRLAPLLPVASDCQLAALCLWCSQAGEGATPAEWWRAVREELARRIPPPLPGISIDPVPGDAVQPLGPGGAASNFTAATLAAVYYGLEVSGVGVPDQARALMLRLLPAAPTGPNREPQQSVARIRGVPDSCAGVLSLQLLWAARGCGRTLALPESVWAAAYGGDGGAGWAATSGLLTRLQLWQLVVLRTERALAALLASLPPSAESLTAVLPALTALVPCTEYELWDTVVLERASRAVLSTGLEAGLGALCGTEAPSSWEAAAQSASEAAGATAAMLQAGPFAAQLAVAADAAAAAVGPGQQSRRLVEAVSLPPALLARLAAALITAGGVAPLPKPAAAVLLWLLSVRGVASSQPLLGDHLERALAHSLPGCGLPMPDAAAAALDAAVCSPAHPSASFAYSPQLFAGFMLWCGASAVWAHSALLRLDCTAMLDLGGHDLLDALAAMYSSGVRERLALPQRPAALATAPAAEAPGEGAGVDADPGPMAPFAELLTSLTLHLAVLAITPLASGLTLAEAAKALALVVELTKRLGAGERAGVHARMMAVIEFTINSSMVPRATAAERAGLWEAAHKLGGNLWTGASHADMLRGPVEADEDLPVTDPRVAAAATLPWRLHCDMALSCGQIIPSGDPALQFWRVALARVRATVAKQVKGAGDKATASETGGADGDGGNIMGKGKSGRGYRGLGGGGGGKISKQQRKH